MEDDDDDIDDDGRIGVRNEGNESVAENTKLSSIGKSWYGIERERLRELWKRRREERENRPQRRKGREREERTQQKRTGVERNMDIPFVAVSLHVRWPMGPSRLAPRQPPFPPSRPCYLHTLTSFTDFHGQTEASRGHGISFDFFSWFRGLSTEKAEFIYRL